MILLPNPGSANVSRKQASLPQTLTFSPVDFENQTLEEGLKRVGFDTSKCTFFSWLGVMMHLTSSAISATLRFAASMPVGSRIVDVVNHLFSCHFRISRM
ncbi:MAG: class I SAM-dependent methyltransferase [Deltaproteobacteria bacterium]|nr:class I SAM-dependent methyltransferase [Deltaproteobacteria bacterium]